MKKKFLWILLLSAVLCGCSAPQNKTLNLTKLNEELPMLADEQFDMANVLSSVEYDSPNMFSNLIDVFDYEYETIGISKEDVRQGIVRLSFENAQMYMVFKPVQGHEEALKESLQNYLSKRILECDNDSDKNLLENALIEENENFIALIVSNDNALVLERINNARTRYFGVLTLAGQDDLAEYGLTAEMLIDYAIQKPMLTSAKTYLIVKPKEDKAEEVKAALSAYLKKMESDYASLPSEQELVQSALISEYEGYEIIIISKNNEAVMEAIKTYLE